MYRHLFQITVAILMVGSILVSAYNYIDSSGSAIQCMIVKKIETVHMF